MLWFDQSKFGIFDSYDRVFVWSREAELMVSKGVAPWSVWSNWCDDAFKFKANLISVATTASCSNTSPHLWRDDDSKHTAQRGEIYFTEDSNEMVHHMSWCLQSPDPNPNETVKRKQPASSQHIQELLEAFRVTTSWSLILNIFHLMTPFFANYIIPCGLFYSHVTSVLISNVNKWKKALTEKIYAS